MTTLNFSIDFTDEQLTGIAQARTAYNATLPEGSTPLSDIEYLQYVLLNAANSYAAQYSGAEPVPPSPISPLADWQGLITHILGGALYPIYQRLTQASFVDPATATNEELGNAQNISVAAGKLDQAVQITRIEAAVAASFDLLVTTSDYRFTVEEKALWDSTVDALNFSSLMHLP